MTVELIWVSQIHRISDSKFEGRLDNYPQHITGKHYQSRVSFTRDQIRDWGHLSFDGKLYGHYTTRFLATSMPDEKAQKFCKSCPKILSPQTGKPLNPFSFAQISAPQASCPYHAHIQRTLTTSAPASANQDTAKAGQRPVFSF